MSHLSMRRWLTLAIAVGLGAVFGAATANGGSCESVTRNSYAGQAHIAVVNRTSIPLKVSYYRDEKVELVTATVEPGETVEKQFKIERNKSKNSGFEAQRLPVEIFADVEKNKYWASVSCTYKFINKPSGALDGPQSQWVSGSCAEESPCEGCGILCEKSWSPTKESWTTKFTFLEPPGTPK